MSSLSLQEKELLNTHSNARLSVDIVELLSSVFISLLCLAAFTFRNGLKWDYVYGIALTIASIFIHFRAKWRGIETHASLRHCDEATGLAAGGPLLAAAVTTFNQGAYAMLAASTWTVISAGYGMHVKSTLSSVLIYVMVTFMGNGDLAIVSIVVSAIVAPTAHALVVSCRHTFTLAEAAAISAAMNIVVAKTLFTAMGPDASREFSVSFQEAAMERSVTIGLAGCVALWWLCVIPATKVGSAGRGPYIVGLTTTLIILLTYLSVWSFATHSEPVYWMVHLLSERGSWPLIMLWVVIISTIVLFVRPDKSGVERAVARKFYHIIALGVFAAGLETDIVVLRLGAVVGLGLLIAGEIARAAGGNQLSRFIISVTGRLVDERDSGAVVVTHIYLLLGCAVTIWAAPTQNVNLPKSALIAVCIQDGAAAAIGKRYGSKRWGRRGRTLEGSVGGVAASAVATYLWTTLPLYVSIIAGVAAAIVEAFTDQVDNWTVPMTFCMVVSACWD